MNVSVKEVGVAMVVPTDRVRMIAGTISGTVFVTRRHTHASVLPNGLGKHVKKDHASVVGLARTCSNATGEVYVVMEHVSVTQDSLVNLVKSRYVHDNAVGTVNVAKESVCVMRVGKEWLVQYVLVRTTVLLTESASQRSS